VHDHLEQGKGGDLDVLEEMRVLVPRLGRQQRLENTRKKDAKKL
jgi:hypothetical protein